MSKWAWIVFTGIILFGMFFIYSQGIQPKSVKVLKPSFFATPEEFGRFTYKTFRPRISMKQSVYIGYQPGLVEHDLVLQGFIEEAQKSDLPFDAIVLQQSVREIQFPPNIRVIDLQPGGPDIVTVVSNEIEKGKKVLVYLSALDAVHFNKDSLANQMDVVVKGRSLTLAMVGLNDGRGVEAIEECHRDETVKHFRSLGCVLEEKEKELSLKKNIKWEKFVSVIDQEGEKDYVVYTRSPTAASQ